MERNWYAVYTKPGKEKRVVNAFSKKRIRNYFPENKITSEYKSNPEYRPLFGSCIFVYISPSEMREVKSIPYVINFLYFKSSYAVIEKKEINLVRQMTASCSNIKLKKTNVDANEKVSVITTPVAGYERSFMAITYGSVKINLPSIGYTLIAERSDTNNQYFNTSSTGFRKIISTNLKTLLTP